MAIWQQAFWLRCGNSNHCVKRFFLRQYKFLTETFSFYIWCTLSVKRPIFGSVKKTGFQSVVLRVNQVVLREKMPQEILDVYFSWNKKNWDVWQKKMSLSSKMWMTCVGRLILREQQPLKQNVLSSTYGACWACNFQFFGPVNWAGLSGQLSSKWIFSLHFFCILTFWAKNLWTFTEERTAVLSKLYFACTDEMSEKNLFQGNELYFNRSFIKAVTVFCENNFIEIENTTFYLPKRYFHVK